MALGVGGTVIARARAIVDVDTKDLDKGLSKGEARFRKFNAVATKAALGFGVAFAIGAKKAVDAASDLNEEVNKSTVIFGKSSRDVLKWSEQSAKSFGSSRRAALQYAGVFGNMLRPMKFSEKAAADMSKRLVELSGDMSSFNNANPEDVLLSLRAGLAGETEPLRKFGVFLNADRVALEALSSGLVKAEVDMAKVKKANLDLADATAKAAEAAKKHGKDSDEYRRAIVDVELAESRAAKALDGRVPKLTAAQKAQATYNLILKDTKLQQGDFARTADSAANRQRTLAAQIEDTKAKLGQGLLPVYQRMLGVGVDLVSMMSKHAGVTKVVIGILATLAATVLAVNLAWKVYTAGQRAAQLATQTTAAVAKLADMTLKTTIIGALIALGIALVVAYQKSERFRDIVNGVFNAVKKVVAGVVGSILFYIDKWLGGLQAIFEAAGKIPGVGKKFDGVAESIGRSREKLRDFKSELDGTKSKEIDVYVKLQFRTPGLQGDNPRDRGDGVVSLSRAIGDGAQAYVNRMDPMSLVGRVSGGALAPRGDVASYLWDELAIARAGGLHITSTHRPGAITSTGNPSLHGVFPAQAFDAASGTNAGFNDPRMRAVFMSVIGRPGIAEVILSPYWWHPGAGIRRISSASVMRGHWNHVHVGARGGDGVVGARGTVPGRLRYAIGDGRVGSRRPPKKARKISPFTKKLNATTKAFSPKMTGERGIDGLVSKLDAKDKARGRLQAELDVRQSELASNDPSSFTVSVIDPLTGESYEVVDSDLVEREAREVQELIDLQGVIRQRTVEIQALASQIANRIRSAMKKLATAIAQTARLSKGARPADRKRAQELREMFEGRRKALGDSLSTYDDKAFEEGLNLRRMDLDIADLQRRKAEIEGTTGTSPIGGLGFGGGDFGGGGFGDFVDAGGGSGGGASATEEQIQERIAREREAILSARSRFMSEFAPNIFTRGADGLSFGSSAARTVTVVQNFTRQPEDPHVWLRKSAFAAEAAFGS